ncbi:unnamed protein product [Discosporangium mesarthrocarpum]
MKFSAAAFAASFGMANAFMAPTPLRSAAGLTAPAKSSLSMSSVDDMIGVSYEVGDKVFDPLGLAELHKVNNFVNPHPKWLREAEIKHGRICMLAFVGIAVAQAGLFFPGLDYEATSWYDNFGMFASKNPSGLAQIIAFIGAMEGMNYPGEFWTGGGDREAGDLGWYLKKPDEKTLNTLKLQELKNGRLAMISVAAVTSEHWIEGAVPLLSGQGY